jgi:hypothetical protein
MRRATAVLSLVLSAALAAAVSLPADAAPGKGNAYGREKAKSPKDIPAKSGCTGNPSSFQLLAYPSGGQTAKALYVLPSVKPKGIVVFDHGYSHTMYSWIRHMQRTARTLGVIAIAPNYRGQVDTFPAKGLPSSRGWRVAEGAVDTNVAAQLFDKACLKGKGHNVLYSVSMGSNTAGLALAAKPKRVGNKPLWDEWVNVEGAANVLETYQGARILAPVNTFAKNASEDIEAEMGGTPEDKMPVYLERSVVTRGADIKASGVKGVVMVHGYADGLVTHDIGRQLAMVLRGQQIPVDFQSWLTRTESTEPGTTLDGYVPTGQTSPFAGHASETSETHVVGLAGFAALADLYKNKPVTNRESLHDGMTGLAVASP